MEKNNIIISFAIAIIFASLIYCIYYFTLNYYREEKKIHLTNVLTILL